MTQLEEYEALVEAIVSSQRYETGAIFKSNCPSQWTVCIDGRHVEFYNSPAEADVACARANARAALAVIAEKAKEWPTERMVKAWSDTLRNVMDYSDTESAEATLCAREDWSLMFAASPLAKPETPE